MNDSAQEIPYNPSPLALLYKLFGGFLGGAIGTGTLLIIFTLTSNIIKPVLEQDGAGEVIPMFTIIFVAMIFLSSLVANIVSNLLMGLAERDKYTRLSTTVFQTFLINLVIFIFTVPLYLILQNLDLGMISAIASLQLLLSIIASSIILEIISNPRYGLIGVYAAVFGTMVGIVLNMVIYQITGNASLIMFTALPTIWAAIGLVNGGSNLLYFQLYTLYGVDFLSSKQSFGADEEIAQNQPITDEEIYEATTEDHTGTDFLQKGEKKD